MHAHQTVKAILRTVALVLFLPAAAYAQEIGVRGGVTAGPAFGFAGIRFAFSPPDPPGLPGHPVPRERLRMRLELDLAGGPQAATMFTWAIESPKLHRSTLTWAPYFGGGLTLFLAHTRSISNTGDLLGGGWCVLFGVENRRRVSMEVQVNFLSDNAPRMYFILGYRFH